MILNPAPELTFDGLDLLGTNEYAGYEFELAALKDGQDWGTGAPIVTWLTGLLQDGAVASLQGHEVRETVIPVRVRAADSLGLAAGESALKLATEKRTTMVWTPPDGWAPPSVFDVITSHLEQVTDDTGELHLMRYYTLRLSCLPFTRSIEPFTASDTSTVTTESTTVRNNGSSTSGWTGQVSLEGMFPTSGGTVSVVSGKVRVSMTESSLGYDRMTAWLEHSGIDMTDTGKPYLRVTWGAAGFKDNKTAKLTAIINGTEVAPSARSTGVAWFPIPAFVTGPVRIVRTGVPVPPKLGAVATAKYLDIDEVAVTNVSGVLFNRQKQFTISIPGAARTEAELSVSHPSNGLGDVLLYTYPDSLGQRYLPILHNYRTSGGTRTTDSAMVSGSREPIGTSSNRPIYTVPAADLPQGTHTLVVRARTTGTAGRRSIGWSLVVGAATDSGTATVTFATQNVWQMVPLTRMTTPAYVDSDSARNFVLTLSNSDGDVQLDCGWLCHTDGALSIIPAGSELSCAVRPATVDEPRELVLVGDMFAVGALAWGQHQAEPPQLSGIVAATGTDSPQVYATGAKRWFTHAME